MDSINKRKFGDGDFYLIAFLVGTLLFYVLQFLFMYISIALVNNKIPGFSADYYNALSNFNLMTDVMWGVQNISQFIGEILLSALMIVFLGKKLIQNFREFKVDPGRNVAIIVFGIVTIVAVSALLNYIYTEILHIENSAENQMLIEKAIGSSSGIFMILTVVFLAPFVEEVLYRQLFIGFLQKKFRLNAIIAVIISAAVFGALHAVDVFFFQYFAMGLVLSGSYVYSKNNIFVPIGIHFINNATVLLYVAIAVFR